MNVGAGSGISSSAQINPGVIVDSDINAAAAIAFSKLAGVAAKGANSDITSLSGLTTALTVEQGGTERTSLDANRLLVGAGAAAPVSLAVGAVGQLLTSGGAGADPSFAVAVGTAGQVLTSAGAGANPAFATVNAITVVKVGKTTRNANAASGTQNIAHGCGAIPKYVRLTFVYASGSEHLGGQGELVYNGTTSAAVGRTFGTATGYDMNSAGNIRIFQAGGAYYNTGVVTLDATNIILTWTRNDLNSDATYDILWEAFI